jgi:hypothetical protein
MPEAVKVEPKGRGLGVTDRRDPWWIGTGTTALVLGFFIIYGTVRTFMNKDFAVGPYLSPFFSPNLEEWLGRGKLPFGLSPAFFILPVPGLFRLTCYYYRKAYYRAFLLDPPGCAVGEPARRYYGERRLLLWQNAHRYVLYFAILLNVWLWVDGIRAFFYHGRLGAGVGSLVILVNAALLFGYTLSCHSLRHLVGGCKDCFKSSLGGNARYALWKGSSAMNAHHMLWAWLSLFWVMFADFYVWMVASGRITDLNTWGVLGEGR